MLVALLTGCGVNNKGSKEAADGSDEIEYGEVIEWIKSTESVDEKQDSPIYDVDSSLPLLCNGKNFGTVKINWIQKINIPDFYNAAASTAGIDYSYTINLHVNFNSLDSDRQVILTFTPAMKDKNNTVVGKECSVGWTGFAKIAQLYDETTEADVEIGLQPEKSVEDTDTLELGIKDNKGRVYDTIELNAESLQNAEEVNTSIATDSKSIESVNGAVVSVGVNDVTINTVKNSQDEVEGKYYDLDCSVRYDSAPTNQREDAMFDSSDNNRLRTKVVFGVVSDVDDTIGYDSFPDVTRQVYSDDDFYFDNYVETKFKKIDPGQTFTFTTNREVPATTGSPKYVRVQFEFPEEANSRSLEEMRYFNGRFCVIQKEITTRQLQPTPENE